MSNYILTAASSAISVIANSDGTKQEYFYSRVIMLFILIFPILANLRLRRKLEDDQISVNESLKLVPQLVMQAEDADGTDIFARPQTSPFSNLCPKIRGDSANNVIERLFIRNLCKWSISSKHSANNKNARG
jgi:hypothetical protein